MIWPAKTFVKISGLFYEYVIVVIMHDVHKGYLLVLSIGFLVLGLMKNLDDTGERPRSEAIYRSRSIQTNRETF